MNLMISTWCSCNCQGPEGPTSPACPSQPPPGPPPPCPCLRTPFQPPRAISHCPKNTSVRLGSIFPQPKPSSGLMPQPGLSLSPSPGMCLIPRAIPDRGSPHPDRPTGWPGLGPVVATGLPDDVNSRLNQASMPALLRSSQQGDIPALSCWPLLLPAWCTPPSCFA